MQGDINNFSLRRNGKIELLRFFFCICVLLFHIQKYILTYSSVSKGDFFSFFQHGSIGVEFFFLLSGFLMAKSIYRKINEQENYSKRDFVKDNLLFIKKKYLSIFPQHLIAFIITFYVIIVSDGLGLKKIILYAIDSIPNLFLFQMSGINFSNPNHVEWYLSCMFIAMIIIYPLCKRFYANFTRYIAPLFSLIVFGYLIYTTKSLTGVTVWTGICYKSLLRAICEISLGTTAFEICRAINEKEYSSRQKLIMSVAEITSFLIIGLYVISSFSTKYEIYILMLLFALIVFAFSKKTYTVKLFNNRFCCFLGKISLPIYLVQIAAITIVNKYFTIYSDFIKTIITIAFTFAFALITLFVADIVSKVCSRKK